MPDPTPAEPIPPSEHIQEELEARNWPYGRLAAEMGTTIPHARGIAEGRLGITPLTAIGLAQAFGTSAEFWLNLQENYDQAVAAQAELKRITPPNAELLKLADANPPPKEWLDGEANQ